MSRESYDTPRLRAGATQSWLPGFLRQRKVRERLAPSLQAKDGPSSEGRSMAQGLPEIPEHVNERTKGAEGGLW